MCVNSASTVLGGLDTMNAWQGYCGTDGEPVSKTKNNELTQSEFRPTRYSETIKFACKVILLFEHL